MLADWKLGLLGKGPGLEEVASISVGERLDKPMPGFDSWQGEWTGAEVVAYWWELWDQQWGSLRRGNWKRNPSIVEDC